jgi:hypothetical protein
MVKYPEDANFMAPSVTGAQVSGQWPFTPWQPSTWPAAPSKFNQAFYEILKRIFQETMVDELQNVVDDVQRANCASAFPLEHRGHVIAVAYMCALDAISAYGYKNRRRVAKFVRQYFPAERSGQKLGATAAPRNEAGGSRRAAKGTNSNQSVLQDAGHEIRIIGVDGAQNLQKAWSEFAMRRHPPASRHSQNERRAYPLGLR